MDYVDQFLDANPGPSATRAWPSGYANNNVYDGIELRNDGGQNTRYTYTSAMVAFSGGVGQNVEFSVLLKTSPTSNEVVWDKIILFKNKIIKQNGKFESDNNFNSIILYGLNSISWYAIKIRASNNVGQTTSDASVFLTRGGKYLTYLFSNGNAIDDISNIYSNPFNSPPSGLGHITYTERIF